MPLFFEQAYNDPQYLERKKRFIVENKKSTKNRTEVVQMCEN